MIRALSRSLRAVGKAVDTLGQQFEVFPYIEKLQPSVRSQKLGKLLPAPNGSLVASTATLVGDVRVGMNSSVWYGAVLRGDSSSITIGESTYIGDNVMIHCDGPPKKFSPALVGSRCIVGAGATMHGATLEDESKVGDRATVLDFAIIRKHGVLAPGSLLLSGKEIKSGELWSGVPAKFQRRLTETEVAAIASEAANLSELATAHAAETDKSWQQQYADREDFYETVLREDYYRKRLSKEEYAERSGDIDGHSFPGRVLDSDVSARHMPESRN